MNSRSNTQLTLVVPVNEPVEEKTSSLAPRPAGLQGKRVGLLDNSKNRAAKLLDMIAETLNERYGFTEIVRHRKPSSAKPVAPEVIQEWAAACDIAIVGVGD